MPQTSVMTQTKILDKYLRDPYLPIDEADVFLGHEFNFMFLHTLLPKIKVKDVFYLVFSSRI
jgi:hypothetical protein